MEFARKQLEKYGWTDGKGLGKHENGISEALKPKLKRSMTGVGHDAASDFTEHWWSTLYDKAASNIVVKEKHGRTEKIQAKDDTGFEITNSTWKLKRKKTKSSKSKPQEQYDDFFVRTAVLGSGGSRTERVRQSESDDEPVQRDVFKMTDEELFAACKGRTAHKGARHGLKALGKLARVEQQEKLLLQQSRFNGYSHANMGTDSTGHNQVIEKTSVNSENVTKLKRKKEKRHSVNQEEIEENLIEKNDSCVNKSTKKKKRKDKKHIDCDSGDMSDNKTELCDGNIEPSSGRIDNPLPQKVKKKNLRAIDKEQSIAKIEMDADFQSKITDNKHKQRKSMVLLDTENCGTDPIGSNNKKHKLKKKIVCTK